MFQQLSSPSTLDSSAAAIQQTLKPEKNSSTEIGIELTRGTPEEANLSGWKLNANYFRSSYDNKIRMFYVPYSPIAYYDNVQNAEISGFEAKASIFLLRNKFTLEFGSSNYSISEKVAFPFKSEHKHVVNLLIEHAGYSLQVHGFKESEQVGWIRNMGGTLSEIRLKGYSNIDLHLSKAFEFYNIEFFVNFSGRNLLDDDTKIEGLTLRDRRFYFTFGIQY
jgi:outer membrane receptor protein involved in Fe transport